MDEPRTSPDARSPSDQVPYERIPWRGILIAEAGFLLLIGLLTLNRIEYWSMQGAPIRWGLVVLEATVGLTWAAFLPVIAVLSLRRPLGRRLDGWALHAGMFATAILVEATVYVTVEQTWVRLLPWSPVVGTRFLDKVRNTMNGHFMASVEFFGLFVGVTQAFVYRRLFVDREIRAARLETALAQSQLQVLRSELHPHFLFNALHAVSTLMHRDVAAAETMLARLGDLLRASIASGETHEVALSEELEFLARYLDIERTRFGDRLTFTVDAASDTLSACVPRLLLQPLVENALRHGIGPRRGSGSVTVRARRQGGSLRLVVADDGLGAEAAVGNGAEGIGLANTRRRLEGLYGEAHRFRAGAAPGGGFLVSVRIPFHTEPRGGDGKGRA